MEMTVFAMLGAVMYCSKIVMEWAPNIHLLGMFTITFTIVYRMKALIPIYVYVLLNGFFAGFQPALMYGLNFKQMLAWIAAGLPFDAVHAIGNFAAGFLILPLVKLLRKIDPNAYGHYGIKNK